MTQPPRRPGGLAPATLNGCSPPRNKSAAAMVTITASTDPALVLPVDVLEVKDQGELVECQGHAAAEGDRRGDAQKPWGLVAMVTRPAITMTTTPTTM